ncbi:MAG: hypothetical protein ABR518_07065, partial [Actinomycetota bacterium]
MSPETTKREGRSRKDPSSTEAINTEDVAKQEASDRPAPQRRSKGKADADSERTAALKQAVGRLRIRRLSLPMDRWLMILGGGLMVAGIAAIILGWYGAAHTPYGFEQLPYMISGGLLGVAVAVLGGLFYFAYWLTRQIQESRRQA